MDFQVSNYNSANGNIYTTNSTLELARQYLSLGFTPIRVEFRTKKPAQNGWQSARPRADLLHESFGTRPVNIGVVLGNASGGLIDIDIDSDGALRFALYFLPNTGMIFGRNSRPSSHWIYRTRQPAPRHKKFGALGSNIVEMRGEGNQTVFPGSVHESGEAIEFVKSGAPANVEVPLLEIACSQIAIATIILGHWTKGQRHELALGISGLLAKSGWDQSDVMRLISAVSKEAADLEIADREHCVRTTFDKIAQGQERAIEGYRSVVGIIGDAAAEAIANLSGAGIRLDEQDSSQADVPAKLIDIATDASAAETFWRCYKDDYIFCDGTNSWFMRHGQTFRPISAVRIQGTALTHTRTVIQSAGSGSQFGQLRAFESRQRINSTVELSRSQFRVDWEEVDSDQNRIGCANGSVIDLKKIALVGSGQQIITKCLGASFNPDAQCPVWLAFLHRIFEGDLELISYIQRAVGYTLTGHTSEQCFFVLVGNGSNGKSTFINALQHLFGDYATTVPMHTLTVQNGRNEQTNDLALLPGKRFVVASEGEVGQKLAESRIKLMTGGDRIKCRRLYQEYFEFDPQFKLWLMTNNLPKVSGIEEAIWRRIHLIKFPVTIPAHERDGSLPEKLNAEAAGILNWALEGLRAWQIEKLSPPEQVLSATAEYRQDNDTVGQFIEACCDLDTSKRTLVKALYDRYSIWCERSGFDPLPKVTFGKTLSRKGFEKRSRSTGTEWKGLKLKAELAFDPIPGNPESTSSPPPTDCSSDLDELLRNL